MKQFLLLFSLTAIQVAYSQTDDIRITRAFIKANNIKLNTVTPPTGFNVYYNCDSMLFMRADVGDTIKILTPGSQMPQELDVFKETMAQKEFGITIVASKIYHDGRIMVDFYRQTNFIFRNDSLFELVDTAEYPDGGFEIFNDYFNEKIDKATYERLKDSLDKIFEGKSFYLPKLIYSKNMFKGHKKKKVLPKSVNFEGDTIILEQEWEADGHKCYLIRINNKMKDGTETTYAYAINDQMRFVWWEGCAGQRKPPSDEIRLGGFR